MIRRLKSGVAGIALVMSLALLASGVMTAQDIKTNYMPGTDFSKYHTYKWVTINNSEQVDPIVVQQIKDAIDSQLTSKGMTKTDADTADMYVGIQTSISSSSNGMPTGQEAGGGSAVVWRAPRAARSRSAHSASISTIPHRSNSSGGVRRQRP